MTAEKLSGMKAFNGSENAATGTSGVLVSLPTETPTLTLGDGPPAGDHRKLALVRVSMLGGMLLVLPWMLALLGYQAIVLPVVVGLVTLLLATAGGYALGRRTADLRGAWLFYAIADTLVVLVLSLYLGEFFTVFLLAVIVELARIYRHGRLVLAGSLVVAGIILLEQGVVMLAPGLLGPLARPVVTGDQQGLLLALSVATVAIIMGRSLSTFIQHYAREIFSYERIQALNAAELHVAHEIQSSLMAPQELESGPWVIAALSVPAKEVGGDFYEYIPALGNSIGGIAIGDVSGKGIPAALQMAVVRTIFRIEARRRIFPAETLTRVNQSLQTEMPQGMVTLLYAFVDPIEGKMHYANAGHNYPVMINGHVEELKLTGLPLGVDGDTEYDEREVVVEAGTSIVFYTDGVVEAMNDHGELFSFERLFALLDRYQNLAPKELVHRIMDEVQAFTGNTPQMDDITVVVLHHGLRVEASRSPVEGTRRHAPLAEPVPLSTAHATDSASVVLARQTPAERDAGNTQRGLTRLAPAPALLRTGYTTFRTSHSAMQKGGSRQ
jgi:serine phosphatase RsbU (regulator of sigma subunit)